MKNKLVAILCCITFFGFGQSQRAFKIGCTLRPLVSERHLSGTYSPTAKIKEKEIFGWSFNTFARVDLSHRFDVQLGLGVTRSGYRYQSDKLVPAVPDPSLPDYLDLYYVHYDMVVPLQVNYRRFHQRGNSIFSLGLVPFYNFRRTEKAVLTYATGQKTYNTRQDEHASNRYFNASAMLGYTYEFPLAKDCTAFLGPTAELNLMSIYKDTPISRRIYTFGVSLGVIFDPNGK